MASRLVLSLLVAIGLAACSTSQPSSTPVASLPGQTATASSAPAATASGPASTAVAVAQAYIGALAAGDTARAESMEDPKLRAAAPAASLAKLWSQIEAQFGAYRGIDRIDTASAPPYLNATVIASFANASLPLIVTVAADGRVAGLHLGQPGPAIGSSPSAASSGSGAPPSTSSASPAAYIDPSRFTERDVTVGTAPWTLPGTLSMPVGGGPFPAVLLVAGSGPQDRDETVGPNKPLADIAQGLASNGIAVLRYDKRTKVHAAEMAAEAASLTVREETIDDAIAGVALLRAMPGIEPSRVFVVGHSLGGFLAPRIATVSAGAIAGIGILEGNTSPLQDLIVEQYAYLASAVGGGDAAAASALPRIQAAAALASSPGLSSSTPASSLPLGIPAAYWLDLRGYDPAATAAQLTMPIFISQGGRDYQVPPSELAGWQRALAGRADVTIRQYPALDHMLLDGSGPSRPAEYLVPGHVDAGLVKDLIDWVTSH